MAFNTHNRNPITVEVVSLIPAYGRHIRYKNVHYVIKLVAAGLWYSHCSLCFLSKSIYKNAHTYLPLRFWCSFQDFLYNNQTLLSNFQAIRDGVIEATIDHEKGYVQSKEISDIYMTREPMTAFHQRISFCLDIHNASVKVQVFNKKGQLWS